MEWKEPLKLFEMLQIVVVDRECTDIDKVADEYRNKYGANIIICHMDEYDVSSTDIRNAIKNKMDFSNLVPQKVAEYIFKHKLYTEEE